ncbi:MAG: dihydroorotase [bacterium]|nr:dihydroorotase [bacterium]
MIILKNAQIVNEGRSFKGNVVIKDGLIYKVYENEKEFDIENATVIDASNKVLIPGIIDCHVHFRDPGLTHKGDIYSESRAGIAGGVTSFMEMPNTNPPAINLAVLNDKFSSAESKSLANYSFYIGAGESNIKEIIDADNKRVCGVKLFMGNSTGNMGVSDESFIKDIFSQKRLPVVVHCEDNDIISQNEKRFRNEYGEDVPFIYHNSIRSADACFKSSKYAVDLAQKYGNKLHIAHLSTAKELELLSSESLSDNKLITSEACVHHLWFTNEDYDILGSKIKCNPSIKTQNDKSSLFKALIENKIDIISTDHAPHTLLEKENSYFKAPSGIPMIQHSLQMMLDFYYRDKISIETIVEKMCHNPANLFNINKRGFIREGYCADLVVLDLNNENQVTTDTLLYKCKWSPLESYFFKSKVTHTFVNGNLVYEEGKFNDSVKGEELEFNR